MPDDNHLQRKIANLSKLNIAGIAGVVTLASIAHLTGQTGLDPAVTAFVAGMAGDAVISPLLGWLQDGAAADDPPFSPEELAAMGAVIESALGWQSDRTRRLIERTSNRTMRVILTALDEAHEERTELQRTVDRIEALLTATPGEAPDRPVRLFLSYARDDDEPFVKTLYEGLTAAGFDVWWDRERMPSRGDAFSQEIGRAIDRADRFLLVWGPAAAASTWVQAELDYAHNVACCVVTPIIRLGEVEALPEAVASIHAVLMQEERDADEAWTELRRVLADRTDRPGQTYGNFQPVPATMVPREKTAADLDRLLLGSGTTVLTGEPRKGTLHAAGGIGKSTLAAAAVQSCPVRRQYHDGVFWLKITRTPQIMTEQARILAAFGEDPQQYPAVEARHARLQTILKDRHALFVLDDVWDKAHAEAFMVQAPGCCWLLTTRKSRLAKDLHLKKDACLQLDTLTEDEGYALIGNYLGFSPEENNAYEADCRAIVTQLGGHTLAVEIAAGVLTEITVSGAPDLLADLRAKMNGQTPFSSLDLAGEDREDSLEASLEYSYRDMAADLRACFRALGVFAMDGTFDTDAVAAVWGEADTFVVKRRLGALVAFSLLERADEDQGIYRQHSVLRAYARALLQRQEEWVDEEGNQTGANADAFVDEWQTVRERHAAYYASLAGRWWDYNDSPQLAPHLEELRAAFTFAQESEDAELIYNVAWDCNRMLDMTGRWDLREAWLTVALEVTTGDDNEARKRRSHLQSGLADGAAGRGDWGEAEKLYRAALIEYETLDDRQQIAVHKGKLADIATRRGSWDEAEALFREALAAFERLGDRRSVAVMKGKLADIAAKRGAWDEAEVLLREALAISEEIGDRRDIAVKKGKLADIAANRGAWDEAEALRREVLAEYEALDDRRSVAVSKGKLADIAAQRGAWDEAEVLYREALAAFESLGDRHGIATQAFNLGINVLHPQGRLVEAVEVVERGVAIAAQLGVPELPQLQQMLADLKREAAGEAPARENDGIRVDAAQVKAAYESGGEEAVAEYLLGLGVPEEAIPDLLRRVLAEVLGIAPEGQIMIDQEQVKAAYESGGEEVVAAYLLGLGVPEEAMGNVLAQVLSQVLGIGPAAGNSPSEEEQFAEFMQMLKAVYDERGADAARVTLVQAGASAEQIEQVMALLAG